MKNRKVVSGARVTLGGESLALNIGWLWEVGEATHFFPSEHFGYV